MKILLVGSGGREHALGVGLQADPACTELHVAPGNPGIAQFAQCHPLLVTDNAAIVELAKKLQVDLVVIGPEVPLVNGVADELRAANIAVFGPSKAAEQLEGSKHFAKEVMRDAGVPTAHSFTCTSKEEIEIALDAFDAPYVVKDDGLAAGKGVVVTSNRKEALDHALACKRVVIEEFLDGPEVSLFGISDGTTIIPMQPAQDFKRAHDGDVGPNTGGMGAYSPAPVVTPQVHDKIMREIVLPTVAGMRADGNPYTGFLYAGLMIADSGDVNVIEFNCRFGDPEAQPVMMRLQSDLIALCNAALDGTLDQQAADWDPRPAVGVVLASGGYPDAYAKDPAKAAQLAQQRAELVRALAGAEEEWLALSEELEAASA